MNYQGSAAAGLALLGACLLSSCGKSPPRDEIAQVMGRSVTEARVRDELRGLLWRRGEKWKALDVATRKMRQNEALEACINLAILEKLSENSSAPSHRVHTQAQEDFQQFLKQFDPPTDWERRAAFQGLSIPALEKRLATETRETLWLEDMVAKESSPVTEQEARAWYDTHLDQVTVPELIRASEIFLTRHDVEKPDRTGELEEISQHLKAKDMSFEDLVAKYSEDDGSKKRSGDMGWFSRQRVPREFANQVFALPLNQVSGPLASHLGWHFVIVREKRPRRVADFSEMKNEIMAKLETAGRAEKIQSLMKKLRDEAKPKIQAERLHGVDPA